MLVSDYCVLSFLSTIVVSSLANLPCYRMHTLASDIVFIAGSRGGSRIRKYTGEEEQLPEEDEPEREDGGSRMQLAGHHSQSKQQHPHPLPHPHHHLVEDDPHRLSSSSSPEWQRVALSARKSRLSREMSDSISVASSGEDEEPTSITMDSSYDETDSAREGMLKMRQLLVKGVLDSEKVYLDILTVLINVKKLLETNSASTQPVICREDVDAIFSNIETIYKIHSEFVTSLEPKVLDWHHEETIGEIFKIMISKFIEFGNYLTNYQQAVSTIHRCSQGNEQFQELAQKIVVTSTVKEVSSLEDALFKPVQRVQRNTLVLHDLIKYTPNDHPDHDALQKALKLSHHILETFATAVPKSATTQENRRLVKSSFLVELVNGVRKLRYVFLFSDLIVCTKRETHRNNKVTFEPKWFTPLSQATFDTKFDYTDDLKHNTRENIDQLKVKIRALKKELRGEMKKFDDKDKHRSLVSLGGATRVVDKLRKKISQYEAQLILASPKHPFKVSLEGGKVYTILMTTDYEREEWKETIRSLCSRASHNAPVMSSIFVQDLINSVKETPQVNKIGSVLLQKDEDVLSGTLNVTIHKMNGLTEDCDTYCCLEMDSFGHFFMKARTHICEGTRDPAWNEDFELELESSQTLRFLCFKRGESGGNAGDTMLGRGALELSKQWLKGSFQEKTVSMNEISLVVSVRHTSVEKTMQRVPSRTSAAVFGVKIASCARREGKTVPTIVTACLQEVEKRGLDEVGIYRVSGVTSDVQRLKKLFDKNVRGGAAALTDVDINAVTGTLKLYFRELPEPLFTEASYQNFVDTLKLKDDEAKAQCMLSLLHGLPDTNYYTIVTLMEHLIKVARNVGENKMSIHNLSTIFGPTLLAPACNQTSSDPLEMMCKGAEQVLRQANVINYLLGMLFSGRSLRRSA
ncbi:Breakpoint cluster region protein [Plakobranchus ocellatus]|uniref:Breakpoint cluster region protein n=1 Tax=Plakobranchus ocellatus TaxID=259542 RepID=A0AAV3ZCE5_9GAST|nr:Breakpoint cluster region protein [Plakobranchus ocellatus]